MPGLNAVFVDIGYEKDAFLHYLDLGPQINSLNKYVKDVLNKKHTSASLANFKLEADIDKFGKVKDIFTKNQQILVQVVKEPISSKGPRLSCEISIAGRYVVLVPFSDAVSISKKIINKEERSRLKKIVSSVKPQGFGVIVRTVAENKDVKELDSDLRNLIQKWEAGFDVLKKAHPRDKIIGEMDRTASILRDMLNESFDSILTDDKENFDEVKSYLKTIAPDKEKILKLYQGKVKIFENFNIEKQVKALFGKTVSMPGGGYLIVEHTEALHVIDVNSGNKSNSEVDQEATALAVNLESVKEIARQLRLRDMGGIIVVDFIDMKDPENRKIVFEKMKEEMKPDRSKTTVLPLSKFGLMEITRQRVRPELNITTMEICPSCNGTGKISASIALADNIEYNIHNILQKQNESGVTLVVHPYLYAYFKIGIISKQVKWFLRYMKWVKIKKDSSLGFTEYQILNKHEEEIDINT
jgi:ribonuclease G